MLVTIYLKGRRIVAGEIKNNVFYKTVKESKHLFRKFDAWGFDYKVIVDYVMPQCDLIVLKDTESNRHYATIPANFGKIIDGKFEKSPKCEIRHYKDEKIDDGAQLFLPRRYWWATGEPLSIEKITESDKSEIREYLR